MENNFILSVQSWFDDFFSLKLGDFIVIVTSIIVILYFRTFIIKISKKVFSFFIRKMNKKERKIDTENKMLFIRNFVSVLSKLSFDRVGGIIVIENFDKLDFFINSGKLVSCDFTPEFVYNIFYNHNSPLHDGAIIIRDYKIISVSCFLPLTKKVIDARFGSRHRAVLGICEVSDCFSFSISETDGSIHFAHKNKFIKLSSDAEKLLEQITEILFS